MEGRYRPSGLLRETQLRIERLAAVADPHSAARNIRQAQELLNQARAASADDELMFRAYRLLLGLMLENGDVGGLLDIVAALAHELPRDHAHHQLAWFQCARAVMDGSMDQSQDLLRTLELYDDSCAAIQLAADWWSGDLANTERRAQSIRAQHPEDPLALLLLARVWAEQGRITLTKGALSRHGAITEIAPGRNWLLQAALYAETVVLIGDREECEIARDALSDHSRRLITMGNGAICWGAVNRSLALLAQATGRPREAEIALRTLIDDAGFASAQPWLIQAQLDLVEWNLRQNNAAEVAILLSEIEASIDIVRLNPLDERYQRLRPQALRHGVDLTQRRPVRPRASSLWHMPRIQVFGGFVVWDVNGREVEWNSKKARRLLRYLIANHGAPVCREDAMRILWPDEPTDSLGNRLAVAITAVRKALDPQRLLNNQHFIRTTIDTVQIRLDHLAIDVFEFLTQAATALGHYRRQDPEAECLLLNAAAIRHADVFADEPYDDIGEELRCRELLALDPYNDLASQSIAELRERKRSSIASGVTRSGPPDNTTRP